MFNDFVVRWVVDPDVEGLHNLKAVMLSEHLAELEKNLYLEES